MCCRAISRSWRRTRAPTGGFRTKTWNTSCEGVLSCQSSRRAIRSGLRGRWSGRCCPGPRGWRRGDWTRWWSGRSGKTEGRHELEYYFPRFPCLVIPTGERQAGRVSEVCSLLFGVDLGQSDLAELHCGTNIKIASVDSRVTQIKGPPLNPGGG